MDYVVDWNHEIARKYQQPQFSGRLLNATFQGKSAVSFE